MKLWWPAILSLLPLAFVCGCANRGDTQPGYLEMRLAREDPAEGFTRASVQNTNEKIYVSPSVAVNEKDVKSADIVRMQQGPAVALTFTWWGSRRLAKFTKAHIGDRIVILVDGRAILAPGINSPITDGRMLIDGHFTEEQASSLVKAINQRTGR